MLLARLPMNMLTFLHLLRLSDIFKLKLLTFVYESTQLVTTSCFHSYFSFSSAMHNYTTRQPHHGDLYLIGKNTLLYDMGSIRYLGAKLWNELPRELRNSSSKFAFRKIYKKAPLYHDVNLLCFNFFKHTTKLEKGRLFFVSYTT